ncbi:MAG: hypothetical protein WAZ12_04145 [Candidatus Absconditicoccaceae bacterium]
MPTKKPAPKKATFDKKFQTVKKTVQTEAKFVEKESKEIATGVGRRWKVSSSEEKIYTIVGIILLLLGLYVLRNMLGGMILLVIGILFVTGFFHRKN